MKLLYTITRYWPAIGGAENQLRETIARLPEGIEAQVQTHWNSNRTDWLLGTTLRAPCFTSYQDGITRIEPLCLTWQDKLKLLPATLLYLPLQGWAVGQMAGAIKPLVAKNYACDLIHNVRVGREGLSYASYKVARARDIPFFLTPYHHPRWESFFHRQYLNLYRLADGVMASTQHERETLIELGVDERKVFVRNVGAIIEAEGDGAAFRHKYNLGDGPVVLFLGQKYAYKGYEALLNAAVPVWHNFPETRFVFIGPRTDYSRKVFAQVKDKRILELDTVSGEEKGNALAACDIFCVPSTQESFGGVFLEAWTYGKPVIGCDIAAVSEVISDGEDGLLTRQEPGAVASKILDLLENEATCKAMGERGKHKVETRYSWENSVQEQMAAYNAVLGRKVAAPSLPPRP